MRFRILNKNPLYDYREACKTTQGIDLWEDLDINKIFKPKDEVEFWIKQIVAGVLGVCIKLTCVCRKIRP